MLFSLLFKNSIGMYWSEQISGLQSNSITMLPSIFANHATISRHHNLNRKLKLREDILAVKGLIVYLNIGQ